MGRRKIEIKAIKDDRNRSVTFLKRKGGLFKKAHELSVLCSVDVAVIIFGHNKKLYEFSSGDINETIGRYQYVTQYGGAHEHKGPEDFMGKKDDDDEDDDDDGAPPRDSHTPPEQHGLMPHHMQHAQQFQHVRHVTPSASPPIPNGFQHRGPSPQPPHHLSRPNSRLDQHPGHVRRSSNLAPPQPYPSQAPPPQPSYAYMPNPPFYNPQAQRPPQGPGPQYHYATHPMPNPQVQQYMQQEQRRQSMPPVPQMQPSPQMQPTAQMQPHPSQQQQQIAHQQQQQQQQQQQAQQQAQQQSQQQQQSQTPQPQPQQQHERPPQPTITVPSPPPPQHDFQSPPLPQPKPLHASAKHSIFTPIDDSQSMLAAHWGSSSMVPPRGDFQAIKQENRSQSIDVAAMSRLQPNGAQPQPPKVSSPQPPPQPPQRTHSTSSVPPIAPPTRTNSLQIDKNKPKLRVQIPSEHSDGGSATADSSPKDSISGATPARSTDASHSSGVVLPPPSPSANSLLSAGATGPPNPFARPPPPTNSNSYNSSNRDMETPISALPSRFVENGLLPSPSSFYPEWGFGRGDSNMLPSPLTFQTPVVTNGPSFARDDSADRKRKTSDGGSDTSQKRVKT
ncbi:resistance to lethality of mkk1p386 overexpression [Nothophoma quercina]|uniref:Resistance to lethality of mkk1p386 overexpression n=1 Tax=Nothophoma quercina TaxID=749835 RepID=A0ABR3RX64_9PLEO